MARTSRSARNKPATEVATAKEATPQAPTVNGHAALTTDQLLAQVRVIQDVLKRVMKKGTHYDQIAGTNGDTLLKPGAEKIAMTFRLAADPEVEDLSDEDCVAYRIVCRLRTPDGNLVGSGVGEASTNEAKYKWRRAICNEEWEDTPEDRRRKHYFRGKGGRPDVTLQIRTEPADAANTVLKMAKKRALVDAVLTATAASDLFTQDVEDMPEHLRGAATEDTSRRPGRRASTEAAPELTPEQKEQRLSILADLEAVAEEGTARLTEVWGKLEPGQRELVMADFGALKKKAAEVERGGD